MREVPVGPSSVNKIFEGMQEPGEAGRDGVPIFERGNVLKVDGEGNWVTGNCSQNLTAP
jgi:hypothetical protein